MQIFISGKKSIISRLMFWFLLLFAILQGVLEWLPVSSEGQTMSLLISWIKISPDIALQIALWLHLGTLLAVTIKYRKEIVDYLNWHKNEPELNSWRKFIVFSTLGTAVTGIPSYILVKKLSVSSTYGEYVMLVIAIALLVTAVLLYLSKRFQRKLLSISQQTNWFYFVIGLFQGFAIIPGISRSGITMSALLLLGITTEDSLKGSFLMSIPAVLGGVILEIGSDLINGVSLFPYPWWQIIVAILVTFIVGLLTIETFLRIARKYNFAVICLILGLLTLLLFLLRFL